MNFDNAFKKCTAAYRPCRIQSSKNGFWGYFVLWAQKRVFAAQRGSAVRRSTEPH